jgi:transcriptional regulator with XRE-family HTH domain
MPRTMSDTVTAYRNDLLRDAKKKLRKSDGQIALETGLSRPTVIAVLKGNQSVTLASLRAVAAALDVTMKQLFTEVRAVA